MTGRGRRAPVYLPRPDPTLETRPVPLERQYVVRSFGPGAAPDVQQSVRSLEQLDQSMRDAGIQDFPYEARQLRDTLREIIQDCNVVQREDGWGGDDPTWGLYIVVTAYSEKARQTFDQAIANFVESIRRYFFGLVDQPFHPYAQDAFTRFRLDVIENKEWLENASDDRVREEFNAYVRSLHLGFDESDFRIGLDGDFNRPLGSRRFDTCVVFDEELIEKLAAVRFPDTHVQDREALRDIWMRLIDRNWDYPEEADQGLSYGFWKDMTHYTGIDMCSVFDFPIVWMILMSDDGLDKAFPISKHL